MFFFETVANLVLFFKNAKLTGQKLPQKITKMLGPDIYKLGHGNVSSIIFLILIRF